MAVCGGGLGVVSSRVKIYRMLGGGFGVRNGRSLGRDVGRVGGGRGGGSLRRMREEPAMSWG